MTRKWVQGVPGAEPELTKEDHERRWRALQAEMERHDALLLEPGEKGVRRRLKLGPHYGVGDERVD